MRPTRLLQRDTTDRPRRCDLDANVVLDTSAHCGAASRGPRCEGTIRGRAGPSAIAAAGSYDVSNQAMLRACLLGAAVGDSIGLPYEGLSSRRARRWLKRPLRQSLILGRGMVSDDTDHSIFVAQAIVRSDGDVDKFAQALAWRLRLWLLCLPAGIGWATLRGIVRLWLGLRRSGVPSAGNGPAMRSALIGCRFDDHAQLRHDHVVASATLTHTDGRAIAGALAVAEAAALISRGDWQQRPSAAEFARVVAGIGDDARWHALGPVLERACESADPTGCLRETLGLGNGVSGFVMHSVPFALLAWYQAHGNYARTVELCVEAGGDVDTNAAIAGALAAMTVGPHNIPAAWLHGLADWPHGRRTMEQLAVALADPTQRAATHFSPALFPRGLVFASVILLHALRRLLPPH